MSARAEALTPAAPVVGLLVADAEAQLAPLHMLVLGYFRHRGPAFPDEVARVLGLGVDLVAALFRELEAAGLIERVAGH